MAAKMKLVKKSEPEEKPADFERREHLRETIVQRKECEKRLNATKAALESTRREGYDAADRKVAAEKEIAVAEDREVQGRVNRHLGTAMPSGKSVKEARAALQAAETELQSITKAREQLEKKQKQAESDLSFANSHHDAALCDLVSKSDELFTILAIARTSELTLANMRLTLQRLPVGVTLPIRSSSASQINHTEIDTTESDRFGRWCAALRDDADAELAGEDD